MDKNIHIETIEAKKPVAPYGEIKANRPNAPPQKRAKFRLLHFIITLLSKIIHLIYRREKYQIFSFDLQRDAVTHPRAPDEISIRTLTPHDYDRFIELWHNKTSMKTKRFIQRMADGYIGTGTWIGGRLIGVNWLATEKDYDYITGLWFKVCPGCCYALDLHEHEDYKDQGIGLTTLIHSIEEAKRRGFKTIYIATSQENKKMIVGARYFLGCKIAGEIITSYFFRRPFSQWSIGNRKSRSKVLVLGM